MILNKKITLASVWKIKFHKEYINYLLLYNNLSQNLQLKIIHICYLTEFLKVMESKNTLAGLFWHKVFRKVSVKKLAKDIVIRRLGWQEDPVLRWCTHMIIDKRSHLLTL